MQKSIKNLTINNLKKIVEFLSQRYFIDNLVVKKLLQQIFAMKNYVLFFFSAKFQYKIDIKRLIVK